MGSPRSTCVRTGRENHHPKGQNRKHHFKNGLANHKKDSGTDFSLGIWTTVMAIKRYVNSYKNIKTDVP